MSKNLLKSSYVVAAMTIISRIAGMAREIIQATIFGATPGMDAFVVAFQIPNFLRRLFAEGAFSQAFVPIISEYRQCSDIEKTKLFVNKMAGNLALILFIVTAIAIVAAPIIILLFAPGFVHDPTRFSMATSMLRVTFPYLFFISLTAFAGSILNSYDNFSVPAVTPVLLNLAMIFTMVVLAPHFQEPVKALAWGVFIGGVIQLAFQAPFLYRLHLLPKPIVCWRDEGVKRVLKLMLPAIFGVSIAQIALLIDTLFASFLPKGSITWLYYSNRLLNFPLAVFGIAVATVVLPHLSRKHAANSQNSFSSSFDWALRMILFLGIPAAIGLLLLAAPIISTILQHGIFSSFDTKMSAKSLIAFAFGLPSFMMVKILATSFYSKQDIKTPVKVAVVTLIINMILNFVLIFPLAHAGLALASTLSSSLNAAVLFFLLLKRKIFVPQPGWGRFALQLLFANAALAGFLLLTTSKVDVWLAWDSSQRVLHLLPLLLGSAIIYPGCLHITGLKWKSFIHR